MSNKMKLKCDELKEYKAYEFGTSYVYSILEVREAIAELKELAEDACIERDDNQTAIDELQDEKRQLKRALWLARVERASDRVRIFYFSDLDMILDIDGYSYDKTKSSNCKKDTAKNWRITWLKVERKCLEKAEEYK